MARYGSKVINILFLGGARRVSLAERFIKSARGMGKEARIFSYELDKLVPISALAKIIVGLKWNDKKILVHLAALINELNINIVLPFVDPATIIAARLKVKCNKNVFIPTPDEVTCDIFYDKVKSYRWLSKNSFPIPEDSQRLPLVAKPRRGSASKEVFFLKSDEEKIFFESSSSKKDYIIQRFIEGDEYTVDCYASPENSILAVVPRRRIEIIAGEVTKSATEKNSKMIDLAKEIVRKGVLIGPSNIQLIKERKSGKLYVIEINPRFAGGVLTSIEAGADIPGMILKDFLGNGNKAVRDWKDHLLMMRSYREIFQ